MLVSALYRFYFWLEKDKLKILFGMFLFAFGLGAYIYYYYYGLNWYISLYYALTQFVGEVKLPVELGLQDSNTTVSTISYKQFLIVDQNYLYIYISAFIAFLTSFLTVLLLFFKNTIKKFYVLHLGRDKEYTLVIGLGENNRVYIESEKSIKNDLTTVEQRKRKEKKIIVIEENRENPHISHFESLGVGFLLGTVEDHKLFIENTFPRNIVISVGNDRENINIASMLHSLKKGEYQSTIYIHLDNHNYEAMYRQQILSEQSNLSEKKITYKPYSFYDDAARNLCMEHTILGNYHYLVDSMKKQEYNIILVGSGKLAERLIYQFCIVGQLPNRDQVNIICIGAEASSFIQKVKAEFIYIENIDTVCLKAFDYDTKQRTFYTSNIWSQQNLTNIILCDDDENINLANAIGLYDKVFLKVIQNNEFKTKVLISMHHNLELGKTINGDKKDFKNFYTFGTIESICSKKYLINETQETLAKLIHFGYGDIYDKEYQNVYSYIEQSSDIQERIEKKWCDHTLYTDRESNRSQALHLNTKLMTLGLVKKVCLEDINYKALLKHNIEIFEKQLFGKTIDRDTLKSEISYFSKQLVLYYKGSSLDEEFVEKFYKKMVYGEDVINKLMRCEHERWNAFHYLNGWQYHSKKNKLKKEHDCLTGLENFINIGNKLTIIYDLYAVLYIPGYLTSVGYKIEKIESPNEL